MATRVKYKGRVVEFNREAYCWEGDYALADLLNALLPDEGPSGADPDPAYSAAHEAKREMPGLEILEVDPPQPIEDDVEY